MRAASPRNDRLSGRHLTKLVGALCLAAVSAPASATDYTSTVTTDLNAGDTVSTTIQGAVGPPPAGIGVAYLNTAHTLGGNNTITTTGIGAHGVYGYAGQGMTAGVTINASGNTTTSINTSGNSAAGLYVNADVGGTVSLDTDRIAVTTSGDSATGVWITRAGTATLKDTTIITTGTFSVGMRGFSNATLTGDTKISTSGSTAFGLWWAGGTIDISGTLTVTTTGTPDSTGLGAYGIILQNGGALTAGAGTVTTHGDNAAAVFLAGIGGTATATLTGTTLATLGPMAAGIRLSDRAATAIGTTNTFTGNGVTIGTSGDGSHAIQFDAIAGYSPVNTVTLDAASKLSTTGAGSHIISVQQGGVQTIDTVAGPGVLVLPSNGANISVTGAGSALVDVSDAGSLVTIKGGGLPAGVRFGPESWGVIAESDGKAVFTAGATTQGYSLWARAGAGTGTITFEGASTAAGSRVRVDTGGVFDLTASTLGNFPVASLEGDGGNVHLGVHTLVLNGAATTQYDGVIDGAGGLTREGTGTTILKADQQYTGPTLIKAGSTLLVDGSIRSQTTVLAAGTLGGGGTIFGDVSNAGTVAPGDGGASGALTVTGAYVGQGGTLAIRTALNDGAFPTSQLILAGPAAIASGSTTISVTNTSPLGASLQTTGLGIPVVVAQNGGATGTGAFTLGSNIVAGGPYEYLLFRGGAGATGEQTEGWYLRSHIYGGGQPPVCTNPNGCAPPPNCATQPGGCPAPTPREIPLYRPEAAVYAAAAGMARGLNMTLLGTFHERAGDQSLLRGSGTVSGAWGRWIGQKTEMSHGGPLSPKFDGTTNGLQIGLDLYGFDQPGYGSDRFGIFGGYARSLGDIDGFALGRQGYKAGKMDLSGYSIGGTWTHVGTGGWYIDAVLMGTSYDGDPRSHRGQSAKVKGYGLTASLESGLPLALGRGLTLEPQAQIVWQYLNLDNTRDRFATIAFDTPSTLSGRLGLRVSGAFQAGSAVLKPYVTANIWQEFAGSDKTIFSGTAMRSGGGNATSAELTGGIAAQVTGAVGLWGDVSYLTDIAGPDRQAWRGNVGVRVTW